MLKTYLYVPEELNSEVIRLAEVQKVSKADVIRTALREGLSVIKKQKGNSAQALLKLAEIGKKYYPKGPKDASVKMDDYLWSHSWSKDA